MIDATNDLRASYQETALRLQKLIAAEELRTQIRYTFTGAIAENGDYEIRIVLKNPKKERE